jgi:hypothetical protein
MQIADLGANTGMGAQADRMDHGDATPPPPPNEESYNEGGMNSGDADQFLQEMDKEVSHHGGTGLGAGDDAETLQGDEQGSPINGNPANGETNEAVDEADENATNGCEKKKSGKCGKSKKSKKSCKSKKSKKSNKGGCCHAAAPPVEQNGIQPTDEDEGVPTTESATTNTADPSKLSQLISDMHGNLDTAMDDIFGNSGNNNGNGETGTPPTTDNNETNAVPTEPANGNDALITPNPTINTEHLVHSSGPQRS